MRSTLGGGFGMEKRLSLVSAVAAACLGGPLAVDSANAVTISIGLQEDGGGIINETPVPPSGMASFQPAGGFGDFSSVSVHGTGNPPLSGTSLLNPGTIDVQKNSTNVGHTLKVYITSQGNTASGLQSFLSSFTSQNLDPGWKLQENTYVDAGNGLFTTTTPLSTALFTNPPGGLGTASQGANADTGAAKYSITAIYTITTNSGGGNANGTINVAVPGPIVGAGLPGLIAACGGPPAPGRLPPHKPAIS